MCRQHINEPIVICLFLEEMNVVLITCRTVRGAPIRYTPPHIILRTIMRKLNHQKAVWVITHKTYIANWDIVYTRARRVFIYVITHKIMMNITKVARPKMSHYENMWQTRLYEPLAFKLREYALLYPSATQKNIIQRKYFRLREGL